LRQVGYYQKLVTRCTL